MLKRALATMVVLAIAAPAGVAAASTAASLPSQVSGVSTPTPAPSDSATASAAPTESAIPTVTPAPVAKPKPKKTYRALPKVKRGMKRSTIHKALTRRGFRPVYRYTFGTKNRVTKWTLPKSMKRYPIRKLSSNRKTYVYAKNTKFIVWLGNGKSQRKWHSGTATWYSIADNTPAGSRSTSSGRKLGWNGGWTFASLRFPLGTKLLVKGPNGRTHECICTDRGGLHTIDLFKPASNRFGMDGMSRFKYQVLRRGW